MTGKCFANDLFCEIVYRYAILAGLCPYTFAPNCAAKYLRLRSTDSNPA